MAPPITEAPRPRSPPAYPDFCGKHRLQVEVQKLNREIGFLEEELHSLDDSHPASRCCKEVNDFIGTKSDPLIPINSNQHKSCWLWRVIRKNICLNFSWLCCSCKCSCKFRKPTCSCNPFKNCCNCNPLKNCSCNCNPFKSCCCSCNCNPFKSCFCCSSNPFKNCCCSCDPQCCNCKSCCHSCCKCPNCCCSCSDLFSCSHCRCSQCCCWDFLSLLCCRPSCSCPRCSCPKCSCGCVFSCPDCTDACLCLCPKCTTPCCISRCLCP